MKQKATIFELIKHLSVQDMCAMSVAELEYLNLALLSEEKRLKDENKELALRIRRNILSQRWTQGAINLKSKNGGNNG